MLLIAQSKYLVYLLGTRLLDVVEGLKSVVTSEFFETDLAKEGLVDNFRAFLSVTGDLFYVEDLVSVGFNQLVSTLFSKGLITSL